MSGTVARSPLGAQETIEIPAGNVANHQDELSQAAMNRSDGDEVNSNSSQQQQQQQQQKQAAVNGFTSKIDDSSTTTRSQNSNPSQEGTISWSGNEQ